VVLGRLQKRFAEGARSTSARCSRASAARRSLR
jgi:hypothetical protein